jgi:hypothetical protein
MNKGDHSESLYSTHDFESRRSKRVRVEKSFGDDFLTYLLEKEPQNYTEVVNSSEGPLWKEVIKK